MKPESAEEVYNIMNEFVGELLGVMKEDLKKLIEDYREDIMKDPSLISTIVDGYFETRWELKKDGS